MKGLIVLVLIGLSASGPAMEELGKMSDKEVLELVSGFLVGMDIDLGVADLEPCIKDTDKIADHIDEAFADFEKESFKGFFDGLEQIALAFEDVPAQIVKCGAVPQESITDLEKALEIFKHPEKLVYVMGKTLILDGTDIYEDIHKARIDYANGKYYDCGKEIGEAMFKFVNNE